MLPIPSKEVLFEHVDLQGSIVLSWRIETDRLIVELEISLMPSHPQYSERMPGERSCFRRGRLVFPKIRSVSGLFSMDEVQPSIDATGSPDYDTVYTLKSDDGRLFYFEGEFGEVTLECGAPRLDLER